MEILKPSFVIEPVDGDLILRKIEEAGRTCYKSEDKVFDGSASRFVQMLIKRGHESVLEHEKISVRIVCDRGVSHELVRHRIASFSQESTRYCNYGDGIAVIDPPFFDQNEPLQNRIVPDEETIVPLNRFMVWGMSMRVADWAYRTLLEMGASPQEARTVLPNSLKTEIVVTANLREWRHFFRLRTSAAAHPQMREIAVPMLAEFRQRVPVVFDDIEVAS
jgi:thymidylate synthase (FAD)